jgi:hypothetical protein
MTRISILLALLPLLAGGQTTNYFAVTAKSGGLESDYSVEVSAVDKRWVLLTWDKQAADSFVVYWGTESRKYTRSIEVKTNRAQVILRDWVTVTPMSAPSAHGPWQPVTNWPALCITNPTGSRFFKIEIK